MMDNVIFPPESPCIMIFLTGTIYKTTHPRRL